MHRPTSASKDPTDWSEQIQSRYQCVLSTDLAKWFDDELWRVADQAAGGGFHSAISPESLIEEAPAEIWPALMPCDFLPILGNDMGDWLCVRLGDDNRASEIVHWYHGGGDWIPWGKNLAEALLFDHIRFRLPGGDRDHAIFAGSDEPPSETPQPVLAWAVETLGKDSADWLGDLRGEELAASMLSHGWCEIAVRCQLVIDALDNPLLDEQVVLGWNLADADLVQRYLFDNRLIPSELLQSLGIKDNVAARDVTAGHVAAQQNWETVAEQCRTVTRLAPKLAWAWDLLGYSLERSGKMEQAIDCYRHGLDCSIFTDQTVRVRTHGFNGDSQKFSAARLLELNYSADDPATAAYLDLLACESPDLRRDQVREHFADLARQADPPLAHWLWKRAGWDLGAEPMIAFADLLEQIAETASAADRFGPSELAKTHRNCFRQRYGI